MLVFVMLVTAATSVVAIRRETPAAVVVRVNGQPLVMRGAVSTVATRRRLAKRLGDSAGTFLFERQLPATGNRPTVATALAAARLVPHPGRVWSVETHRVVGRTAVRIVVDGGPALLSSAVRSGDRVEVASGVDMTEAVVARPVAVAASGLPDVERTLWHAPAIPTQPVLVGVFSGEIVASTEPKLTVAARPETDKVVALTFDDGPDPRWTPAILAILHDEGVPATFCLVGRIAARLPALARAEVAAGHTICNHTVDHDVTLDRAPHQRVVDEIGEGADLVRAAAGVPLLFYRPPGGALSPDVVAVAHANGQRVLDWSVDPSDYRRPPAAEIVARILANVGPGGVVLMHDGGGDRSQTVAALRPLIEALKARGYRFSTPAQESPAT
ncbi:MAG: polysaccharide deacetylase family protein [Acidimicrobiales bacterium]